MERPVWAQVDLTAIAQNILSIKSWLEPSTEIMAVVKANAYGHGVEKVAQVCLEQQIDNFAVSILSEGIQLRQLGIGSSVLVMGYTPPEESKYIISHNLSQSVFSLAQATAIAREAKLLGKAARIHIKVDTGMGRVGFLPHQIEEILAVYRLSNLQVEGIFTHFAAADDQDHSYTNRQLATFNQIIDQLKSERVELGLIHAANSAGILQHRESQFNLVRPGLIIYGMYPSPHVAKAGLVLNPAMSFRSRIAFLKRVPAGTSISYSCTFHTKKESLIATLPLGYADGYPRLLSNRGHVLIKGQMAPIVGRICMDQVMVDVTNISQVKVGDVAVLFGYDEWGNILPIEQVAQWADTINYELVCKVSYRVPRRYL